RLAGMLQHQPGDTGVGVAWRRELVQVGGRPGHLLERLLERVQPGAAGQEQGAVEVPEEDRLQGHATAGAGARAASAARPTASIDPASRTAFSSERSTSTGAPG